MGPWRRSDWTRRLGETAECAWVVNTLLLCGGLGVRLLSSHHQQSERASERAAAIPGQVLLTLSSGVIFTPCTTPHLVPPLSSCCHSPEWSACQPRRPELHRAEGGGPSIPSRGPGGFALYGSSAGCRTAISRAAQYIHSSGMLRAGDCLAFLDNRFTFCILRHHHHHHHHCSASALLP